MKNSLLLISLLYCLAPAIAAQTVEFRDVPGCDGVQGGYNRFSDTSTLATKRSVVSGVVGKKSVLDPNVNSRSMEIAFAVSWKGDKQPAEISEVILLIFPEPSTKTGAWIASLEGRRLYIEPEARLVAIADGERIDLGPAIKPGGLTPFGNYNGAVGTVIPLAKFRRLIEAKKLELAAGSIEINLHKQPIERARRLLARIDSGARRC